MDMIQTLYNCGLQMKFTCDQNWFLMKDETDEKALSRIHYAVEVKRCKMCDKSVYRVDKPMGLIWGVELGLCMAFDPMHYADKPENNPHAENTGRVRDIEAEDFKDLQDKMLLGVFIKKES
jgi:hypothetical protein